LEGVAASSGSEICDVCAMDPSPKIRDQKQKTHLPYSRRWVSYDLAVKGFLQS